MAAPRHRRRRARGWAAAAAGLGALGLGRAIPLAPMATVEPLLGTPALGGTDLQ